MAAYGLRMVSDPANADIRVVAVRELPGDWFAATTTSCDSPCRPLRAVIRIERSATGFALRHGVVSGSATRWVCAPAPSTPASR